MTAFHALDGGFLLWVQQFLRNPVTDPVVSFFTHLGDSGLLFIALTLLLLLFPKTRKLGCATALGLLCSLLFTNILLKHIFQRPRPWLDFPALVPLVDERDPNSFPSGHASAAFAFGSALLFTEGAKRWMKVTGLTLAALMALSRLYVGVHYPTDVLAGILVGFAAGLAGSLIAKSLLKRFSKKPSAS